MKNKKDHQIPVLNEPLYIVDFSNTSIRIANSVVKEVKKNKGLWATLPQPVRISRHEQIKTFYFGEMLEEILGPIIHQARKYVTVIATEAGRPTWRYKLYPKYKHNRSKTKGSMPFDFTDLVEVVEQELLQLFRDMGMFIVIEDTKMCEGDDYVGALLQNNMCSDNILLSTDSDFKQYCHKAHILSMFAENKKFHKKMTRPEAQLFLTQKIFAGDTGDGITAVFPRVSGEKTVANHITSGLVIEEDVEKFLIHLEDARDTKIKNAEKKKKDITELQELNIRRQYARNKMLIDLAEIPPTIVKNIMTEYLIKRQSFAFDQHELTYRLTNMGLATVLQHAGRGKRREY